MGGLIVQRALVKYPKLRARVSQVILFGTPSRGLVKATLVSWLKQQTQNMSASGPFVESLREDWTKLDAERSCRRSSPLPGRPINSCRRTPRSGPLPKTCAA